MSGQHVLLTGGTGFVGKVVLYELIRRRQELNVERITLIVREGGAGAPRLACAGSSARAFAGLPSGWASGVETVGGDLVEPRCGLADDAWERLTGAVTQIIHCAASIEFDLPIVEAAQANIGASLNVLQLAQACAHLQRMVAVSTAYVSPHPGSVKGAASRSWWRCRSWRSHSTRHCKGALIKPSCSLRPGTPTRTRTPSAYRSTSSASGAVRCRSRSFVHPSSRRAGSIRRQAGSTATPPSPALWA